MAQSGWYDDPDGTPDRLRYWDGTQWTGDTMARPAAAPAAPQVPPTAPTPAPQYPDQAPNPTPAPLPTPAPGARRRSPLLLGGAVVGVLALVFGANALLNRPGTPTPPVATTTSSAPRSPATSPRASTVPTTFPTVSNPPVVTAPPLPTGSGVPSVFPTMIDCPAPTASTLTDGVISVPVPAGFSVVPSSNDPWQCEASADRQIADGWYSNVIVGSTPADGTNPSRFAQDLWGWIQRTGYDPASVTKVTPGQLEPVKIGGLSGVKATSTVEISGKPGITGDTVTILVLAKGDRLSSLMTVHTTNDAGNTAEIKSVWDALKVAG